MRSLPAFYATETLAGECPHSRARLVRDVTVATGIGPFYVECVDCDSRGGSSSDPSIARALWRIAGLTLASDAVRGLILWELARMGDPEAADLVREALA